MDSGLQQSVLINTTLFDSDDCVQSGAINDAIAKAVAQCGGYEKAAAGPRTVTFQFSVALAKTDVTKINAVAPGTVLTAFEAHPGGDEDGNIEIISTDGLIESRPIQWGSSDMITMDVTCHLNNVTFQAASS